MGMFGFGLPYTDEHHEMAENQMGMSLKEIKKIDDKDIRKEKLKRYNDLLDIFLNEDIEGKKRPSSGRTGGMVIKSRKGNKIAPRKPKVAGRRATRGYGKAFKGK